MNPTHPSPLHPRRNPMAGANAIRCLVAGVGIALLAACGGGGGGGGGGGSTTPPPPPPPGTGAASNFYLSGASGGASGRSLALTGVEPVSGGIVNIPNSNLYATNVATIAEWTAANGSAAGAGIRYRVWAGSDGNLYNTDLADPSGSVAPSTTQFSTYSTNSICGGGVSPTVLNDLATPSNSAIVFRDGSGTNTCGAPTDKFVTLPLSATATTVPPAPSVNEPVAVGRNATGAITKVLFLIHSAPAAVGVANSFSATPTVLGPTAGSGLNLPAGDFASIAVVAQSNGSLVWVYRDLNQIFAANLTTQGSPVPVFTAADRDVIQLPAIVVGTTIYVAMTDTTNGTCQLIAVDTAGTLTASSGRLILQENTAGSGLTLIGVIGSNLVYFNDNVVPPSGGVTTYTGSKDLKYIPIATSNLIGSGTLIDQAVEPNTFDGTSPPIVVGNGLYYAIDTPRGSFPYQAYYYSGSAPVAIGTYGSLVLGGAIAATASISDPAAPTYSSAILALQPLGGNLPSAQIVSYGSAGNATATLGTLPPLGQGDTYTSLMMSEPPLQEGMPALILVTGLHNNTNTAQDLIEITPGKASSLHQATNNLQ